MTESTVCMHCGQLIDQETDDFVVINHDASDKEQGRRYAHTRCQSGDVAEIRDGIAPTRPPADS